MERIIVVRGTLNDPTHIELDEPVTELHGPVEVVVRRAAETSLSFLQQGTSHEAWEAAFDAWVEGHDRSVPLPTPESLRREGIYGARM
ncbi:MAG: hypothetical protein HYZ72_12860 [Deltaproteobacteria bacterium]|nr:hypothetical protein [Deltaproteobacteria bacterium]